MRALFRQMEMNVKIPEFDFIIRKKNPQFSMDMPRNILLSKLPERVR